jgi:hypothetical protein
MPSPAYKIKNLFANTMCFGRRYYSVIIDLFIVYFTMLSVSEVYTASNGIMNCE